MVGRYWYSRNRDHVHATSSLVGASSTVTLLTLRRTGPVLGGLGTETGVSTTWFLARAVVASLCYVSLILKSGNVRTQSERLIDIEVASTNKGVQPSV